HAAVLFDTHGGRNGLHGIGSGKCGARGVMRILLTGGGGYLGSALTPKLLTRGHQVRVLDIGYFGLGHLKGLPGVELIRDDLRRVRTDRAFCSEILAGCDCVIHLAAISNDPSAELQPELTNEVNFEATVALAEG